MTRKIVQLSRPWNRFVAGESVGVEAETAERLQEQGFGTIRGRAGTERRRREREAAGPKRSVTRPVTPDETGPGRGYKWTRNGHRMKSVFDNWIVYDQDGNQLAKYPTQEEAYEHAEPEGAAA